MKRLALLILMGLALSGVAQGQTSNTFNPMQFQTPGASSDVGTLITRAQNACNPTVTYPCVIIIDPALSNFAVGTLPAKCAQCTWTSPIGNDVGGGIFTPLDTMAKGDAVRLTSCGITSGQNIFTCAGAAFTSGDVGKAIVIRGAGVAGIDHISTISGFTSATVVTLAANASSTVSAQLAYYGSDDTSAIRSCIMLGTAVGGRCTINNGRTFMMSNTATTVRMVGTGVGGILDGTGTIVFAPAGTLTGGLNDRFLYISSSEATPIQLAAGAIAKGATTFTANSSSDVSTWVKGDWIILTEKDPIASDVVYVDWVQVSGVAGAVVTVITPFRMAFPNARTWNVSGSPAVCIVASPCGFSARKVTNITNATLRDFRLVAMNAFDGTSKATGIVTRDTRGMVIDNITCDASAQNCLSTYLDQGLTINNPHFNHAVTMEIASTVDFSIRGLQSQLGGTAQNNFVPPQGQCVTLDYGTGFGTVNGAVCGNSLNDGFYLNAGVHDLTLTGSHIGWIKGTASGAGLQCVACYRVVFTGNVLDGGDGSSTGISFLDGGSYTVPINSDSNQAIGNVVNAFPTNFSCSGANGNDNCDDYSATTAGLRTIRNAQMTGLVMGEAASTLVNGANNDVALPGGNGAKVSYTKIIGPSAVFSVSGFTGGVDGRILYVFNSVAFAMTITNEAGSTAANRITTLTGADVVLRAGTSYATFIYDGGTSRWKLVATN